MNEIRILTALELRSLYGINRFLHTKDKKERGRYKLLAAVVAMLFCMICAYVVGLVVGLCALGLSEIVPAYLAVLASIVIFVFDLFKAGSTVFSTKGLDMLVAMPLRTGSIAVSRFAVMYLQDLLFTLTVMLPGVITYGILQHPAVGFYAVAALGMLLLPAIPLVAASLIGTFIMAVSARMKRKNMVQTVLLLLFVIAVLVGSFALTGSAEMMTPEFLSDLAVRVGNVVETVYPPAAWLGNAMLSFSVIDLSVFVGVSLGAIVLSLWLITKLFQGVTRRLSVTSARHDYKMGALKRRGLLKTLYVRETRRYFASGVYVTNTIIGPIMGALMSAALCFVGTDAVQSVLPINMAGAVPFVFAAVFCMMTTTSVSVSMEGKRFWIVKSLPIPSKTLFDAKILLNLSLMLPFYVLSQIFLIIALRPNVLELLWLLLIPAAVMLFSTVFGITVNLKFHRFDWEKEETVVKQSASAALGGFAGTLLSVLIALPLLFLPASLHDIAKVAVCVLLAVLTYLLYRKNNTVQLHRL